ncbi:MAG: 2Fe-2S iron-sulfur cluster binding domain-containing protein, partial [Clostridiaceae bacterium]|nr:2Fe-2S iron-sulfur cluster binding domain-containing protein [Clostridiaceae bacterium]
MPTLRVTKGNKIWDIEFEGNPKLQAVLAEEGFVLPLPCGGTGRCGKCTVEIDGNLSTPTSAELRHGKRLSCQITLHGDADVRLPDESPIEQIQTEGFDTQLQGPPMEGRYGGAVDIGTTTLALKLYDLQKGILLTSSALQ